ncbi:MAG: hypothetical protein VW298_02085 [Candidatus Woesearchaeota archaeon]
MIFTNTNNKTKDLINFKIPPILKTKFKKKCDENYKTMSNELIDFIKTYIKE